MKRRCGGSNLPPHLRLCQYNEGSGGQDTVAGTEVTKLPPVADSRTITFRTPGSTSTRASTASCTASAPKTTSR